MCLSSITASTPKKRQRIAYKVFRDLGDGKLGYYMFNNDSLRRIAYRDGQRPMWMRLAAQPQEVPQGIWLKAQCPTRVEALAVHPEYEAQKDYNLAPDYPLGFHGLTTHKYGERYCKAARWAGFGLRLVVRQVMFKDVLVEGKQKDFGGTIIVARYMLVFPEIAK